jgi:hypothetical protein
MCPCVFTILHIPCKFRQIGQEKWLWSLMGLCVFFICKSSWTPKLTYRCVPKGLDFNNYKGRKAFLKRQSHKIMNSFLMSDYLICTSCFATTQKSCYIYRSFIAIFTSYTTFPPNLNPCILMSSSALLTWRTSFFACSDEYPSTLVSSLPTIVPPLALPLAPFHTPQFKLHYLHRQHQQSRSSSSGTLHMQPIIVLFVNSACLEIITFFFTVLY